MPFQTPALSVRLARSIRRNHKLRARNVQRVQQQWAQGLRLVASATRVISALRMGRRFVLNACQGSAAQIQALQQLVCGAWGERPLQVPHPSVKIACLGNTLRIGLQLA